MDSRYRSTSYSTPFTLNLFEEDFINIATLVSRHQDEETGGNLFGLWTNYGNAVVLVATGPGKDCSRTAVSFYQDIAYMGRIGHLLTNKYPLCHIGEWHSHHQLRLSKPSEGDNSTIRRNYPRGSQGFILMIANILYDGKVTLSPYKFVDEVTPYQPGKVHVLNTRNPFNEEIAIKSAVNEGKETTMRHESRILPRIDPRDLLERGRHRELTSDRSRSRSRSPEKTSKRSPENVAPLFHNSTANERYTPHPPCHARQPIVPRVSRASGIRVSPSERNTERKNRGEVDTTATRDSRASGIRVSPPERNRERTSGGEFHANRVRDTTLHRESSRISTATPWYESNPVILKPTVAFMKELSDNKEIKIERDKPTKQLSFEFRHHHLNCVVQFPNTFPLIGEVILKRGCPEKQIITLNNFISFKRDFRSALRISCLCSQCKSHGTYRINSRPY